MSILLTPEKLQLNQRYEVTHVINLNEYAD